MLQSTACDGQDGGRWRAFALWRTRTVGGLAGCWCSGACGGFAAVAAAAAATAAADLTVSVHFLAASSTHAGPAASQPADCSSAPTSVVLSITSRALKHLVCLAGMASLLRQVSFWNLPCELWYHISRAYPYDSNGALALVIEICLHTVGEVNGVAIDAG